LSINVNYPAVNETFLIRFLFPVASGASIITGFKLLKVLITATSFKKMFAKNQLK
jgi:hypothetical protein